MRTLRPASVTRTLVTARTRPRILEKPPIPLMRRTRQIEAIQQISSVPQRRAHDATLTGTATALGSQALITAG